METSLNLERAYLDISVTFDATPGNNGDAVTFEMDARMFKRILVSGLLNLYGSAFGGALALNVDVLTFTCKKSKFSGFEGRGIVSVSCEGGIAGASIACMNRETRRGGGGSKDRSSSDSLGGHRNADWCGERMRQMWSAFTLISRFDDRRCRVDVHAASPFLVTLTSSSRVFIGEIQRELRERKALMNQSGCF